MEKELREILNEDVSKLKLEDAMSGYDKEKAFKELSARMAAHNEKLSDEDVDQILAELNKDQEWREFNAEATDEPVSKEPGESGKIIAFNGVAHSNGNKGQTAPGIRSKRIPFGFRNAAAAAAVLLIAGLGYKYLGTTNVVYVTAPGVHDTVYLDRPSNESPRDEQQLVNGSEWSGRQPGFTREHAIDTNGMASSPKKVSPPEQPAKAPENETDWHAPLQSSAESIALQDEERPYLLMDMMSAIEMTQIKVTGRQNVAIGGRQSNPANGVPQSSGRSSSAFGDLIKQRQP